MLLVFYCFKDLSRTKSLKTAWKYQFDIQVINSTMEVVLYGQDYAKNTCLICSRLAWIGHMSR